MKAIIVTQREQYTRALTSRAGEIEHLKLLVAKLQRMLFGAKSEKCLRQIEQLELKLEELEAASSREPRPVTVSREDAVAQKPARRLARIADHPVNRIEDLLPWNTSRIDTLINKCPLNNYVDT